MKKAILDIFKAGAMYFTTFVFEAVIWAEKAVYFRTGLRGWVLRSFWKFEGRRLQKALNKQHGTAIRYGDIVSE